MQLKPLELSNFCKNVLLPLSLSYGDGRVGVYSASEYRSNREIPLACLYFVFDYVRRPKPGVQHLVKVEMAYVGESSVSVSLNGMRWQSFNDYDEKWGFDALLEYVRTGNLPNNQ